MPSISFRSYCLVAEVLHVYTYCSFVVYMSFDGLVLPTLVFFQNETSPTPPSLCTSRLSIANTVAVLSVGDHRRTQKVFPPTQLPHATFMSSGGRRQAFVDMPLAAHDFFRPGTRSN
jgi:hypothetical protein